MSNQILTKIFPTVEERLLSFLKAKADRRGSVFASIRELQRETGAARNSVRRALSTLDHRGLILVRPCLDENGAQLANEILVLPAARSAR